MKKRTKLAEARYSMGWSQEDAAENVGVTRTTFSQWERGVCDPYPIHVHRLCEIFKKTAEELDLVNMQNEIVLEEKVEAHTYTFNGPFYDEFPHANEDRTMLHHFSQAIAQRILQAFTETGIQDLSFLDAQLERLDMNKTRREILQMFSASTLLLGLDSKQLFTAKQNDGHLIFLEHQMTTRWDLYHTGGTDRAYYGLDAWLKEVEDFAQQFQDNTLYERSHALLSMSYQLQGSLLRDKMSYQKAHSSYEKAFRVATEIDDTELQAASLARRGVTYVQQQQPTDAIEYLEAALKIASVHSLPHLSGYIAQALSEAHAMAGQAQRSQQSVNLADVALGCNKEVMERSYCQPNTTSVTAQRGVNAVLLKDYDTAITLIDKSLMKYNPTFIRGRARLIAQKAEAYYGKGYIDMCSATAQEALTLAYSVGSSKTVSRLQALHANLYQSRWKSEKSVIDLGLSLHLQ
jgi:DNA-binding XRE family transcriptional regulator/tetratricopeptide (TPR) repeat protein